jgi:cytochrome P450
MTMMPESTAQDATTAPARSVTRIPGTFLVGSLLDLARDPLELLMRGVGHDMTEYRFGPKAAFLLNHPDLVRRVFVETPDRWDKRTANNKVFRLVFGNSLVTSDGDYWKRQRRIAAPAFHHQRIRSFVETMRDSVDRTMAAWSEQADGATIDFDKTMITLTLDVVSRCLIGAKSTTELTDVLTRELLPMLEYGSFKMPRPWYPGLWAPTPMNRRFLRGREAVREAISRIIAERHKTDAEPRTDLLAMLMSSVDEETGEKMDDIQLRDEVITIVLAGYETTTNLLDWTFYALSKNPEVRRNLEDELARVLGDRDVVFEDLASLKYTDAVIKESLRVFPPAWLMVRRAAEDDVLLDRPVPEGSLMLMSPYVSHRRSDFFPDPERFSPDRFLEGRETTLPKLAYFPFGGGRRTCIGNTFAMVESKIVLAQVCRKFRFEVVPGTDVRPHANVMLKPRGGLEMTLHHRPRT